MQEICKLMGTKKVNTSSYHPQTDGLVERFNKTLTSMLAKTVEKDERNWDHRPPMFCLLTEPVYRNRLENHLFICCMDVMPDYPLKLH